MLNSVHFTVRDLEMPSMNAPRDPTAPLIPHTLGERLKWAYGRLPKAGRRRGLRLFQWRMETRAKELKENGSETLTGYHLSSIQGYVNGRVEPTLTFLREAAPILGVRFAWLATGEGKPTEVAEQAARMRQPESPIEQNLKWSFPDWHFLSPSTRGAIVDTWSELTDDHDRDEILEQHGQYVVTYGDELAEKLGKILLAPLDAVGLDKGAMVPRDLDTYIVLVCQAIRTYARGKRRAESESWGTG